MELTAREIRKLRSLNTPYKIQQYLEHLPYHDAGTAWSPRLVLREGTAHCLEGAILAATALRVNGFPPLLWDLEAVQDTDHVLAIYRVRGHWGAIGLSAFAGLRFREPIYKNFRELALSYFDDYFNYRGERTLRAYASRPLDLRRFDDRHWMTTPAPLWFIAEALVHLPHTPLLKPWMIKPLNRVHHHRFCSGPIKKKTAKK
jgi:hypothetical protein